MHLPHTDWLYHRLAVSGPAAALDAFRHAARGAGTIPWHLDLDRMEEDAFHRLVSPPAPHQRTLSVAGARILAARLRAAVALRHDRAVARVGISDACALDLHALLPVPESVLRLGPDDSAALAWLWGHWGTTLPLRHVEARDDPRGDATIFTFWSADWTPWRALAQIAGRWPALRLDARPRYIDP